MKLFSLVLRSLFPSPGVPGAPTCKYHPSCSQYASDALRKHGPVKGSLKNQGIEAYFSTVVSAKKVNLKELEAYGSNLLNISEDDQELGYKHVFQCRLTKATVGERIRSPMGLFDRSQTYMDNDAQLLLEHLHRFYH